MPLDDNEIYNGEPQGTPEQAAAKRARQLAMQARLPKFELGDGELYIPREELAEINDSYFRMLDEMKSGLLLASAELRSYMESVIFASYKSDINKAQRNREIEGRLQQTIHNYEKASMTPQRERSWFLGRKRPNYPLQICMQMAALGAQRKTDGYRDEISKQEEFIYGESGERANTELFDLLIESFVPRRKRKRFIKRNGEFLSLLLSAYVSSQTKTRQVSQEQAPEQVNISTEESEGLNEEDLNVLYELEDETDPGDTEDLAESATEPEDELADLNEIEDED